MKISKKFVKSIADEVKKAIGEGKTNGEVSGFNFYIDKKPENTLLSFPLGILNKGENGTVYIGGKAE